MSIDWTVVTPAIGAFLALLKVGDFIWKTFFYSDKKNKQYISDNKILRQINDIVLHLWKTYDFDRVAVDDLHNGGKSHSGYSFQKITRIAEKATEPNEALIDRLQGYPVSEFSARIDTLAESPAGFLFIDNKTSPEDLVVMQMSWDVKASYSFLISKYIMDGMLSLSYTKEDSIRVLSPNQVLDIKAKAYQIGRLKKDLSKPGLIVRAVRWSRQKLSGKN